MRPVCFGLGVQQGMNIVVARSDRSSVLQIVCKFRQPFRAMPGRSNNPSDVHVLYDSVTCVGRLPRASESKLVLKRLRRGRTEILKRIELLIVPPNCVSRRGVPVTRRQRQPAMLLCSLIQPQNLTLVCNVSGSNASMRYFWRLWWWKHPREDYHTAFDWWFSVGAVRIVTLSDARRWEFANELPGARKDRSSAISRARRISAVSLAGR